MMWNWQQTDWPSFYWDDSALKEAEARFQRQSGILIGATRHVNEPEKRLLVVDLITSEAIKTSEIEGELLNRDSVQSSILSNFGLTTAHRRVEPAERGVADLMTNLYRHSDEPLTHSLLFAWHKMLTSGREDLIDKGRYRTDVSPMQVVSGRLDKPKVHFEAPPSDRIQAEMDRFLAWWQLTEPGGKNALPPLTRTGVAHLYFVCIHPFEDGNGRIGRALAEKSLAAFQGAPTLIALSQTIEKHRNAYYDTLAFNNKSLEITAWLNYFAQTVLDAQAYTVKMIDFLIAKTKLYDRVSGRINPRQEKVLDRMFREGVEGFKGGLSAKNYSSLTGASRATTTRDLQDLVDQGALLRTGSLKSTRYHLNIEPVRSH